MTLRFDATDDDLVLFLEEASEQLKTLSDGLLNMERAAEDTQLIQAVFRAAHTLKGSSATIAHHRMAGLTHAIESVLDLIRKGELQPDSAVIDCLLASVDALLELNEEVVTRVESDVAIESLVSQLQQVAGKQHPATLPVKPRELADADQVAVCAALQADGQRALDIDIVIDPKSEWPAVRAYQALTEIAALGNVVRSWPGEEELQIGESGHSLRIVVVTDRESQVLENAARGISEVIDVAINAVALDADPDDGAVDFEAAAAHRTGPAAPREGEPPVSAPIATANPTSPTASVAEGRGDEPSSQSGARHTTATRMVKVDIVRLDELMNLVGELVIDRGRLTQVMRELTDRYGNDQALEHLSDITQHLSRVSDDLQDQMMLSRLLPVDSVFNRFPRMVRDLARKSGKAVRFLVEGGETGLDRSVIDEIGDPLLHLLRNAVDHGVEPSAERLAAGKSAEATITLSARHEENYIVIEVADDGRGIDPKKLRESAIRKGLLNGETAGRTSDEEAINLIFAPGFSSAEKVTEVSGRGVGMDIVRTNIEKINGTVRVRTDIGHGTTFSIKLPLTLAIIRALLVREGESIYSIPLVSVQETLRIRTAEIHTVQRRKVVLVRGQALPLVRLADVFRRPGHPTPADTPSEWCYIAAVRTGSTELGLIVDGLVGEQEVVIKSISSALGETEGIAGATILGDGRVSMIVDVPMVVERLAVRVHAELVAAA